MSIFLKHLLKLYKNKQINQEVALSLIEEYKNSHQLDQPLIKEENFQLKKIAIIGLSVRMPLANTPQEFWENLCEGKDCIRAFPESRRKDIDPITMRMNQQDFLENQRYWNGGFLEEIDKFDNDFFEILPAEAKIMDPQQRIFLELAYEAFEDAGYTRKKLRHTNTGVFLGDVVNEYRKIIPKVTASAVVGNISPFITSRVSYFYDFHGPAINISTTCSTSLVAVHAACQALLQQECELALVGAINLRIFPFALKEDPVDALGITTQDNCCRAFDNQANGIVRGEGGGALVLKSYEQAIKDNDHIYATLLGSSVNNDGRSSSVGAPNPVAQEKLLQTAWKKSGINPRTIHYIEAHGTGTKIGDPIEVTGISRAFSAFTLDKQFCGLGSVKTNLGHLTGGASGLAGLIKTLLALKHNKIPPTLHFKSPNEWINFPDSPVFVTDKLISWPSSSTPKRAGVSAFGFNGTNCHVVLEESAKSSDRSFISKSDWIFVLSHQSETGLRIMLDKFYHYLKKYMTNGNLGDICYTLAMCRDHYKERIAIVGSSIADIVNKIESILTLPQVSKKVVSASGEIYDAKNALETNETLALALQYCLAEVEWQNYYHDSHQKVSLPTYAFEKKRFWVESNQYRNEDNEYLSTELTQKRTDVQTVNVKRDATSQLIEIFKQLMGLEDIKIEDNFFDLGLDSLLGIQLINEIHKTFHKKISYQDLFNHPRMIDLLALLEEKVEQSYQDIEILPSQENYQLSFGQRRLWILHQMQDNPIAYNMYEAYEFEGLFDLLSFQEALNHLIQRHSIFRTIFLNEDGQPVQKIIAQDQFNLNYLDLRLDNNPEKTASLRIEEFKLMPFDLEKSPLTRILLIRITEVKYLLFFVMHHIISDGWSIRIIIQDLLKIYQSLVKGHTPSLEKLKIQYVDYAHWQHQVLSKERFQQLEQYWLRKFSDRLPICEIAGDKPRPPVFHFQGTRRLFAIPDSLLKNFSQLASQQNATLFMTLLTSVYIFIYRYSGNQDIIVGTPVSGRSHHDLKNLVGFFVNTIALRSFLKPNESFYQLLQQVKIDVLEAFEHQDYPFDLMIDKLKLERDTSRSPVFNINVAFQNFELDEQTRSMMSELSLQRRPLEHHSCKWDLEFEFIKKEDGSLCCFLEYYKGIYSHEMIEILIENYLSLLQSIIQSPHIPIDSLKMDHMSLNIINKELNWAHTKEKLADLCLHTIFENQTDLTPYAPAIKFYDKQISYDELNRRANQLAHFLLHKKGILKEELIGIFMENSIETIVSILAILKSGCAYVPLDIKAPIERLRKIIQEGKIQCIISKKKSLSLLNQLQWSSIYLSSYICLDSAHTNDEIEEHSSSLMNEELWNQVAEEGENEITTSGWVSSYTGLPFSRIEMEEYQNNVLIKLQSILKHCSSVLEIGCGSGLTLFTLAPHVSYYFATDLSSSIIEKNKLKAKHQNISHIQFQQCLAHQIDQLAVPKAFDLIILNSVVHCFPGLNYFKKVIKQAINQCADKAVIFLGDLMDQTLKEELENSLKIFKQEYAKEGYRTKIDWSQELFIHPEFLKDLQHDFPEIESIQLSRKHYTIENELTRFRFDALLSINKKEKVPIKNNRYKYQYSQFDFTTLPQVNVNLSIPTSSLAYVIFTSGSTGIPKGVMIEHQTVKNYIDWAIQAYFNDVKDIPCFPFYSPLTFDLTVTSIFSPLFTGSYLRIYQGEFDEILKELAETSDCNILKLTPAHLSMLLETKKPLISIRKFILGGEALYSTSVNALHDLYQIPIQVYNEYGPTEATVGCIVYQNNEKMHEQTQVPIGVPISNANIHLLNSALQPVPIGGIGEICIGGQCLARGYLYNQQLTEQSFIPDPFLINNQRLYRTGDLARYLPNGILEYLGRNDRQIKIKGYRIELNEIEAHLIKYSQLKKVAITIKEDIRGKIICAYYSSDKIISPNELRDFMQKSLPDYMIPNFFIQLEKIPHSPNGKIDYLSLPQPFFDHQKAIVDPKDEMEKSLLTIWSQTLGISSKDISIDDDFFELGGDSIMAMRILPKLNAIGFNLTIKEIFQFRTIAAISQHLKSKVFHTTQVISQVEIVGKIELTPIQLWFFEHKMPFPHYFNMAYLFKIPVSTNENLLAQSIDKCLKHHDMLRTIYKVDQNTIQQINRSYNNLDFDLQKIDLSTCCEQEQRQSIQRYTKEIQSQFNLIDGPLFVATLFDLGNRGKRLFIAIHHLLVDGVSWRYLVEDIELLYHSNLKQSLPSKTHSYQEWANQLKKDSLTKSYNIDYWLTIKPEEYPSIVKNKISYSLIQNHIQHVMVIDPPTTYKLLSTIHHHYHTNVNDVLLTALFLSLTDIFNLDQLLINHEGHGRTGHHELNVNRTVGWFTTIYPIGLKKQKNLLDNLLYIRQTLRHMNEIDVNYGIARFLQENSHLKQFQPEVLFNYFGHVGTDLIKETENKLLSNCTEEIGQISHSENKMPHFIEVNAIAMDEIVQISIMYDSHSFSHDRMQQWIILFEAYIRNLIDLLNNKETR